MKTLHGLDSLWHILSGSPGMNAAVRAAVRMGIYVGAKVYFIHEVSQLRWLQFDPKTWDPGWVRDGSASPSNTCWTWCCSAAGLRGNCDLTVTSGGRVSAGHQFGVSSHEGKTCGDILKRQVMFPTETFTFLLFKLFDLPVGSAVSNLRGPNV